MMRPQRTGWLLQQFLWQAESQGVQGAGERQGDTLP